MTGTPTRVAVLISGEGTNLQALIDAAQEDRLSAKVVVVISNRGAARGLERARTAGIATRHLGAVHGQERAAYDSALAAEIAAHDAELVVLAGFMRILSPQFVDRFAGRIVNIHPSLLPAFPGADAQRQALAHGVKITRRVAKDQAVNWNDVAAPDSEAVRVRREMEALFRGL